MMVFYLDKEQIVRLASNGDVYKRGVSYFKENRVKSVSFETSGEGDDSFYVAKVAVDGNYNDYNVDILFNNKGILQKYRCNCDAFGMWRGGCKHVVAALLRLYEVNYEAVLQSRINRAASTLLSAFEQQALEEIDGELANEAFPETASKVAVKPCLCSDASGEIFLTLTVGRKRMYIVKNMSEFVENVINGAEASYGKGLAFAHKKSVFEPQSYELVDFVIKEYNNYEQLLKSSLSLRLYSNGSTNSRKLALSKRGLDDFFDLYKGTAVESGIAGQNVMEILLSESRPDIKFDMKLTANGMELSDKNNSYSVFEGERFHYIAISGVFHRVPPEYCRTLTPIKKTLQSATEGKITFGKQEYGRLSTFLLPKLRKFDMVDDNVVLPEDFREYELVKKAYLDSEEGSVTCRLMFCYGSEEINALHSKKTLFTRNVPDEYKCRNLISQMGFVTAPSLDKYKLTGNDLIYDFYKSEFGVELLRKTCEIYASDEFMNKSVKPSSSASFGLRLDGGLLHVSVDTDGYSREELLDILQAYRLKKRFHRLKDGSFISLEEGADSLGAAAELISGLGLSDKDIIKGDADLPKYRALYAEQVLSKNQELEASKNKAFKSLARDFNSYRSLDFDIPPTLDRTLRSYQKEGFNWLNILRYYGFGGILADDMGLGKTLQVISVILAEKLEDNKKLADKENHVDKNTTVGGDTVSGDTVSGDTVSGDTVSGEQPKPSIVVSPTSLIYNWEKEFNRFAPEIRVMTIAGLAAKRKEVIVGDDTPDVYITTYDMLKRDIEYYKDVSFRFIIADEAQNIKNPLTQNAKAIKELDGETKFALTGTPIENSLSELWSIFDFVMPGYLFGASKFSKHYETPILKYDDENKADELKKQISPFILRRVKRDVLKELPEKIETTLYAEMPPEQKKIYTAYLYQVKGELEETIKSGKYNESKIEILSMLTRLRQICCHPATFIEDYEGGSGKLDITAETVQNYIEGGHRILIFSQFTKMLAILKNMLDSGGIEYFYLDGSTPSKERLNMTERFNAGFGKVFLISLKAGGTGLNLTGADVVIHYDPWWNPAVMDQASDRAHRFGQKRTVQVLNIVAKDSIEEKIIALQGKKRDLVDSVIQEGANFINHMTQDDILELFKE